MRIFYGICGEGLGHCGRSMALIERLAALGHRVTLFSFGDAQRLLLRSGYQPHAIDGLHFGEGRGGGVSILGTAGNFTSFLRSRDRSIDLIRQLALSEQPDLFITDFEPLTARTAELLHIPCVSIDSQHRFCHPLSNDFPARLRLYGRLAGAFVSRWIRGPRMAIVSVFHHCPPSPSYKRADAFVRDRFVQLKPSDGEHVVLYARGELGRRMVEVASTVPCRFIAYGANGVTAPNIEFKQTSYEEFVADLAACRAVVCAGGQQLLGEARYFGKRVLTVPIPRQHEQEVNARYAELEGIGEYCPIEQLTCERIECFLQRRFSASRPGNGVDQALDLLGIRDG